MLNDKLGYVQIAAGPTVVKSTPAGLFGVVCIIAGQITVYDNNTAAAVGNKLFDKAMAAGEVMHLGGTGVAAKLGLVATGGLGTANIIYT